jgi:hypothetical protein
LMLAEPGTLSRKQQDALANVLAHMREDPAGRGVVDDLECRVGARTSNVAQLQECTAGLAAKSPNDAKTITYLWALAVARGDSEEAKALVARAQTAGVPAPDLAQMTEATQRAMWTRVGRLALWILVAALLAGAVGVLGRGVMARRRLVGSA